MALGTDFCFMARQKRLPIGDRDYYVDLVFFQRRLKCPVLVDLKLGELEPADIAQMQLYLAWMRQHDKQEGEDDPIGLILCGSKNAPVIELLLADPTSSPDKRIKVAQYLLLDNETALKERLAQISAAYDQAQEYRRGQADPAGEDRPDGPGPDEV